MVDWQHYRTGPLRSSILTTALSPPSLTKYSCIVSTECSSCGGLPLFWPRNGSSASVTRLMTGQQHFAWYRSTRMPTVCLVMLATSRFLARSSILSSPRNPQSDCLQSPCSWLRPDVSTHSMKKMEAWYFLSLCSCSSSIFSQGTVSWMRATNVIYTFIT